MSTPYESADLLMKLYDLRREATMREARNWYLLEFSPSTIDDVMGALTGPHSAYFRMVISYWEMATSFVSNGAIDQQMFNDANGGEYIGVLAKIEPFLPELRTRMSSPQFLTHLEQAVMRRPGAAEMMAVHRERLRAAAAARAAAKAVTQT